MSDTQGPSSSTPILPAHIQDPIQAIATLYAEHRREAGSLQQLVEHSTAYNATPKRGTRLDHAYSVPMQGVDQVDEDLRLSSTNGAIQKVSHGILVNWPK